MKIFIFEWSQGLTLTQNVDWGFLLSTTFPKILMSSGSKKKEPRYATLSPQRVLVSESLQVPQWGPCGEKYPLTWHFYHSLKISLFIFPSESPIREPTPCSLTGSPWAAILRHQSHCGLLFIHSFIHVCLPESPKGALLHTYGENIRSPSTEPHVDGRPTYNEVRRGSPRGSLHTAASTPLPCSLRYDTFHLGFGRPEPS